MKKSKKKSLSYIFFAISILCLSTIYFLSVRNFCGNVYFASMIILYSLGIIFGILCLIFSIVEYRKITHVSFSRINQFLVCFFCVMPMLIFQSVNYYKDLCNGIAEIETDIYEIPIESYYAQNPDEPKYIAFYYNGYCPLDINDDIYSDLVNNNLLDKNRTVDYQMFKKVYPHMHYIRIRFYPNTKIIDEIQILYD